MILSVQLDVLKTPTDSILRLLISLLFLFDGQALLSRQETRWLLPIGVPNGLLIRLLLHPLA